MKGAFTFFYSADISDRNIDDLNSVIKATRVIKDICDKNMDREKECHLIKTFSIHSDKVMLKFSNYIKNNVLHTDAYKNVKNMVENLQMKTSDNILLRAAYISENR